MRAYKPNTKRLLIPKKSKRYYAANGFRAVTVKRPLGKAAVVLAVCLCVLLVPFLIMTDIRRDAAVSEWWTTHIQAGWEKFAGTLTSWLPFSVLEFFIVLAIIVGVFLVIRLFANLCRARFKRIAIGALALCVGGMYLLDMYILSMGFGYYRSEMPIPQSGANYTADQAAQVIGYYLNDFNALAKKLERDENGCVRCPYTFSELAELVDKEYSRLDNDYFGDYTPRAKPVVNSWFLSDMLITGITFLPFGEVAINVAAPPTSQTLTMAHELAHAKGIQREGDANLLARYLLVSSSDDYLRYCGYYGAFNNLLQSLLLFEDYARYNEFALELSSLIYAERKYANDYWNSQPDYIGQIAELFNDIYLKLNGSQNGTDSYYNGNQSSVVTPIDPSTGEPAKDPETGEQVKIIVYSQIQMMFFWLYENRPN